MLSIGTVINSDMTLLYNIVMFGGAGKLKVLDFTDNLKACKLDTKIDIQMHFNCILNNCIKNVII